MLSECPQTQVRVTEIRFEIESEFRFHLFSHTAPEWGPDLEKCCPMGLRRSPKMLPEGLWKALQGTAWRRPGKGPKKTPFVNKSIMAVPWGIARGNAGLRPFVDHSPISLTLPLSSPKGDGFATTPARGRRLPVRASVNTRRSDYIHGT